MNETSYHVNLFCQLSIDNSPEMPNQSDIEVTQEIAPISNDKKWMIPLCIVRICCATTDSTSTSILLNSSKQDQAPQEASPLKNLPKAM